jgi:hypothetical protein
VTVARVRLRIDDFTPPARTLFFLRDPRRGATEPLPILRLTTRIHFGPDTRTWMADPRLQENAVIDTGAWISMVKKDAWEPLDRLGLVEHLERLAEDGTPAESATLIGGQRLAFTLGRIWIAVIDSGIPTPGVLPKRASRLPAVPVLCQLLQDEETVLKMPVLLGLHRGVLDGRQLRRVPVPEQATPHDRVDVGPRYGQQWWLQDES